MPSLIDIDHLSFAYGQNTVLENIRLSVESGSTLGLIGPNGGGKTTLVRLLLGMLQPSAGTIRIAGMTPKRAVARGNVVGYLPQNPRVPTKFPINVRQMVRLGLVGKTGILRQHSRDDLEFVDSLIERVG